LQSCTNQQANAEWLAEIGDEDKAARLNTCNILSTHWLQMRGDWGIE